jgi:general secretion pathway protein K
MAATARAEAAATAALHAAALALSVADRDVRWEADARPHLIPWPDATVSVKVSPESGRIDLNRAPRELLVGLFEQYVPMATAEALADAVVDWRDADDDPQPAGAEADDYARARYGYAPANGVFNTVGELRRVLGFDTRLVERLSPYLTVYSGRPRINLMSADLVALLSVPDIDADTAAALMAQRERVLLDGGRMDLSEFPEGRKYLEARPNDTVLSIDIDVRLDDGLRRRERAVIRLNRARLYTLLARETRATGLQPAAAQP